MNFNRTYYRISNFILTFYTFLNYFEEQYCFYIVGRENYYQIRFCESIGKKESGLFQIGLFDRLPVVLLLDPLNGSSTFITCHTTYVRQ